PHALHRRPWVRGPHQRRADRGRLPRLLGPTRGRRHARLRRDVHHRLPWLPPWLPPTLTRPADVSRARWNILLFICSPLFVVGFVAALIAGPIRAIIHYNRGN